MKAEVFLSQFPVGFLGCYAMITPNVSTSAALRVSIPCRVSRLLRPDEP